MSNIFLIYYFIILVIGLVLLGMLIFIFIQNKKKTLMFYIFFSSSFTLTSLTVVIFEYMILHVNNISMIIQFHFLFYLICFFLYFSYNFSLLLFIHTFFNVKFYKIKNIVAFIFSILTFLLYIIFARITIEDNNVRFIQLVPRNPGNILLLLSLIYVLIVSVISFIKTNDKLKKSISIWFVFLLVWSVFGILNDYHIVQFLSVKLLPILNILLNIVFLFFFTKKHLVEIATFEEKIFDKYNISIREKDVLRLLLIGKSYKDISDELFISLSTVKTHINNIYKKTKVSNRYELLELSKKK